MKLPTLVFTALTLLPFTGCIDQNDLGPEGLEVEENLSVKESAICFYIVGAPVSADYSWNLNLGAPKVFQINSYGNASCRRVTVGYQNAASAKVKINYPSVQPVYNASTCAAVTVRARFWYFDNGAWTYVGTKTDTGTWLSLTSTCLLPEVSHVGTIIRDEIRAEITTESNTSTELPVKVTGDQ